MSSVAAFLCSVAAGETPAPLDGTLDAAQWDRVGDLAEFHQVEALCWWMIRSWPEEAASDLLRAIRDRWRLAYLHHRLRNEALGRDLEHLLSALTAAGVRALVFKGPWMAFHAYPDPGTRPVGDVDLCVREADYRGAVDALQGAGWSSAGPLPESSAGALAESHYRRQLRFVARGRRPVELHFRMLNMGPPGPAEEWVWESRRRMRLGSTWLEVPGPEAMLLHLLLHANQHGFAVLRLLHDVRWALEADRGALDMSVLQRSVRRLGCGTSCHHALELAVELAGAIRPSGVEAMRPPRWRRKLFAALWRLGAVRRLRAPRRRQELESPWFYCLEMGRPIDKLRYVLHVARWMGAGRVTRAAVAAMAKGGGSR